MPLSMGLRDYFFISMSNVSADVEETVTFNPEVFGLWYFPGMFLTGFCEIPPGLFGVSGVTIVGGVTVTL